MRRITATLTAVIAAGLLLGGCASSSVADGSSTHSPASGSSPAPVSGTVNVFAAASLQEALAKLGHQFEIAHPGVKIFFNSAPSPALPPQTPRGAPADV